MRIFDQLVIFNIKNNIKILSENVDSNIGVAILNIECFRDEVEALLNNKKWSLISLPISIQDKINALSFYCLENISRSEYDISLRTKENNNRIVYLERILPKIIQQTKITCFISCGMYHSRNIDWEIACVKKNIPFFCLHREGNGVDKNLTRRYLKPMVHKWRKFHGTKLFLGNNTFREVLLNQDYIEEERVVTVGAPRIDLLVNSNTKYKINRPKIVLFSFPHVALLNQLARSEKTMFFNKENENGFYRLFHNVHKIVSIFAIENPNIDVVIKPKWYSGDWKMHIDSAINSALSMKEKTEKISNLIVTDNVSAQKLINDSSLVIAFNSSTILESIIAKTPVVIPYYEEATKKYSDYIAWSGYFDKLNIAKSSGELASYLSDYINISQLDANVENNMVSEAFGYGDGNNTERLYKEISSYH
jgi:hypothetical protein